MQIYWLRFVASCAASGDGAGVPSVVLAVNVHPGVDEAAAQAWMDVTRGELAAMFAGKLDVHTRAFALDCRKPTSDALRGLCSDLAVRGAGMAV